MGWGDREAGLLGAFEEAGCGRGADGRRVDGFYEVGRGDEHVVVDLWEG